MSPDTAPARLFFTSDAIPDLPARARHIITANILLAGWLQFPGAASGNEILLVDYVRVWSKVP